VIRHGSPPFLECSSYGDRRFSAFHAQVRGRSIEGLYQAAKVFEDGSTGLTWRRAKGRRAVNARECAELYRELWREYIVENPELLDTLLAASGLSDMFGKRGHCCQATELWLIRAEEDLRRSLTHEQRSVVERAACGRLRAEAAVVGLKRFAEENGFTLGRVMLIERGPGLSVFRGEHDGRWFEVSVRYVLASVEADPGLPPARGGFTLAPRG